MAQPPCKITLDTSDLGLLLFGKSPEDGPRVLFIEGIEHLPLEIQERLANYIDGGRRHPRAS